MLMNIQQVKGTLKQHNEVKKKSIFDVEWNQPTKPPSISLSSNNTKTNNNISNESEMKRELFSPTTAPPSLSTVASTHSQRESFPVIGKRGGITSGDTAENLSKKERSGGGGEPPRRESSMSTTMLNTTTTTTTITTTLPSTATVTSPSTTHSTTATTHVKKDSSGNKDTKSSLNSLASTSSLSSTPSTASAHFKKDSGGKDSKKETTSTSITPPTQKGISSTVRKEQSVTTTKPPLKTSFEKQSTFSHDEKKAERRQSEKR
jgi:hypothetical protein